MSTLSVRTKWSHRCVSLKETPLKPVQILKHTAKNSADQASMRTKWLNRSRFKPFRCISYKSLLQCPKIHSVSRERCDLKMRKRCVSFCRVPKLLAPPFAERSFRKKSRNLRRSFRSEICSEIRPENFGAFLPGRKVLPQNFTRFFPSEISNFKSISKSNFTKNFTNTLLQAWQP